MSRGTPLARGKPLPPGTGLTRSTPLRRTPMATRHRDTGPTRSTRKVVYERGGGWCEWPGCTRLRTEVQHRLGRKDGGRHGAGHERVNGVAWLLGICSTHHRLITSAAGATLAMARATGWVLTEDQDAAQMPVLTRHHPDPVLLLADGSWRPA